MPTHRIRALLMAFPISLVLSMGGGMPASASQECELPDSPGVNTRSVRIQPNEEVPNTELESAILNRSSLSSEIRRLQSSSDFRYSYNLHDLNNDGELDALVAVQSPALCGTGGCPQLLFVSEEGQFEQIGTEAGMHVLGFGRVIVLDRNERGWDSLAWSAYNRTRGIVRYIVKDFDGRRYVRRGEVSAATSISGTAYLVCGESHSLAP
jgi:hypothetical protein